MKKNHKVAHIAAIVIAAAILLVVFLVQPKEEELTLFEKIAASPCILFESAEEPEGAVAVYPDYVMGDYFGSIALEPCDIPVDQWLYRITFNTNQILPDGEEIVMEVGERSLSIDGELYTAAAGTESFNEILDYVQLTYDKDRDSYPFESSLSTGEAAG